MKKILTFILLLIASLAIASEDYYVFSSIAKQQRFNILTEQLRCLVCQNQTIAESNAPLANDLRNQIYQKINSNQSDKEIIDYLISRYGNFILYKPPLNITTLLLWLGPFILLFIGISYLIYSIRYSHKDTIE